MANKMKLQTKLKRKAKKSLGISTMKPKTIAKRKVKKALGIPIKKKSLLGVFFKK